MNRLIFPLVLGVFALSWPFTGEAQNDIPYDVMGGGGGQGSDGSMYLHDTVGEQAIGILITPANIHKIGYWYCVDALHIGPTTAVLITAFEVFLVDNEVELRWAIGNADGLRGFNIYRSGDDGGPFERVNASIISLGPGEYSYRDLHVRPRCTYRYRLGTVDSDGEYFSHVVSVEIPAMKTALHQNYPNPFNPQTTISFYLAEKGFVNLTIYDVQGRRVRRLLAEERDFGKYEIVWNGSNDWGEEVGSGVYFYRLVASKTIETKKLTLLK